MNSRTSLHEAIDALIAAGHGDPVEMYRTLERKLGPRWLRRAAADNAEHLLTELMRQRVGRVRRAGGRQRPTSPSSPPTKEEVLGTWHYIPGVGKKLFKDCTVADLEAREELYLRAARQLRRWASWYREVIDVVVAEGVETVGQVRGPLPLPPGFGEGLAA